MNNRRSEGQRYGVIGLYNDAYQTNDRWTHVVAKAGVSSQVNGAMPTRKVFRNVLNVKKLSLQFDLLRRADNQFRKDKVFITVLTREYVWKPKTPSPITDPSSLSRPLKPQRYKLIN
jgi:hypothetical protein